MVSIGDCICKKLLKCDQTVVQDSIPTSLLKLSHDNSSRAVKMFAGIQRYMDESQEGLSAAQSIEIVQKLLHQGLKRPELKDELFMQLLKQSRGNPSPQAAGMCSTLIIIINFISILIISIIIISSSSSVTRMQ